VRIKGLEKNKIDTTTLKTENDELKARVAKLEQKQLQNDKEETNLIAKLDNYTRETNQSSVNTASYEANSNDTPVQIVSQNKNVIFLTTDESNDTSAKQAQPNSTRLTPLQSNKTQCSISLICAKPKSSEDKEMIDFLDRKEKEGIRDMMIKRNREKKLLQNNEASASRDQNVPEPIDQTISSENGAHCFTIIEIPYNQKVEQGLRHE
ncbi:9207_t:CDS:1, partial [Paraglomus brasilianum]